MWKKVTPKAIYLHWMIFSLIPSETMEIVAVGDKTWARTTAKGTHREVFIGLPPTEKTFTVTRFDVCRFEGGKIIEHWGVIDRLGLLQQLSAVIQPAHAWQTGNECALIVHGDLTIDHSRRLRAPGDRHV